MSETLDHPTAALLGRLSTLSELPHGELEALSRRLFVHEERKGAVLLPLGATDASMLYLLEGECRLVAADGGVRTVRHTDSSALTPLARLRPSRYKVEATSHVRYLRIESDLMAGNEAQVDPPSAITIENYQVEEGDDVNDLGAENRLTLQIYEDLNSDHLLLPSLPHVAVRIGEAVNDDNANARNVAALIETDPAMALKIVKAANSARFGGVNRLATVSDAVTRLGMQNTQILVVTFTLRELFRTSSKMLEKRMLALWEHSRRIAALAQVLGNKVGGFNPHEALLAGLVHDIGVLAVIGYARNFPDVANHPAALESSIRSLRTQLSGMILAKWQLPAEIVTAAKEAESWLRDGVTKADYADLVIAAQVHEGLAEGLPLSAIPAIARLGLSTDDVGEGIELLHSAQEEVAAAKRLLAG
ncbi:MAG: HDOD domain-containing protein [Chromatiaceae bacterium]|nr:HDOD domain-containing protein [Gammaproteobacteria bacterium]MCP5300592.1 HDOD domain-containing protein [Chromatiaceae bacterium]MCP5422664.1 HDOD domain-containing protein [Chromatiaceae bacterium]